jgi:hypothetical protein
VMNNRKSISSFYYRASFILNLVARLGMSLPVLWSW